LKDLIAAPLHVEASAWFPPNVVDFEGFLGMAAVKFRCRKEHRRRVLYS
jgi:hypothetical protein